MDPYLEASWRDVHTVLVAYSRDALNGRLPDDLIARTEERVAIESEDDLRRLVAPDVRIFEAGDEPSRSGSKSEGGVSVAEPVLLKAQIEPLIERYVTVVDANSDRLVTVIEFLSPTNKRPGDGMRDYVGKRKQFVDAGVNVVEIDLVRQGDWIGLLMPYMAHPKHHTTYRVVTRRASTPGQTELYPIPLRTRLPIIPIPLRTTDRDVTLDLQPLIEQAYRNGRYERTIDYARACDPALSDDDVAWAKGLPR